MRPRAQPIGARVTSALQEEAEAHPESELTSRIIGCAIAVHRELGPGFLEAVYENALSVELNRQGLAVERQKTARIRYQGVDVGEHRADLVVEGRVVVELKSVDQVLGKHVAQVISTLKALNVKVGLLLNFDEARLADGVRRVVLTNT